MRTRNPGTAASLREGLEATLTVIRLGLPAALRKTLTSTKGLESALRATRYVTARVKRWRDGDMRKRWFAAGLMRPDCAGRAKRKLRRVKGVRQIPRLPADLESTRLDAKPKTN